jgi:hypothetical protein
LPGIIRVIEISITLAVVGPDVEHEELAELLAATTD